MHAVAKATCHLQSFIVDILSQHAQLQGPETEAA